MVFTFYGIIAKVEDASISKLIPAPLSVTSLIEVGSKNTRPNYTGRSKF